MFGQYFIYNYGILFPFFFNGEATAKLFGSMSRDFSKFLFSCFDI